MQKLLRLAAFLFLATAAICQSPIQHVVVIMLENRSFDHLFGTYPGANGATKGTLSTGAVVQLSHAPDAAKNSDHGWTGSILAIDNGKMDKFDLLFGCKPPASYTVCYSQYWQSDIPNLWAYAQHYVLADNFFSSIKGGSYTNHQYSIAAQSGNAVGIPVVPAGAVLSWGCDADPATWVKLYDPATNTYSKTFPCFDYATLSDRLEAAGLGWASYCVPQFQGGYQWCSFDSINHIRNDQREWSHIRLVANFATDARAGKLPAVTWVTPGSGLSCHPTALMSKCENWLTQQINAIMAGPEWASTAIFVSWDDFGGFYDHVPPPKTDPFGFGIRVPLLIISPFVNPGTVCHTLSSFDSLLSFVESNWSLPALTQRDANAGDLTTCMNLKASAKGLVQTPRPAPKLTRQRERQIEKEIQEERVSDDDD
ncbi:MAG TPA: alkaline phosphatase family protein [Terriglobales bacterium]|nr:alkaline phosphatase family protein [Terriglobales bacterium]